MANQREAARSFTPVSRESFTLQAGCGGPLDVRHREKGGHVCPASTSAARTL